MICVLGSNNRFLELSWMLLSIVQCLFITVYRTVLHCMRLTESFRHIDCHYDFLKLLNYIVYI
jgi:hypothetical protein